MERKPVVSDQYSIRQQARNRVPLPKATVTLRRPKQLPNPPGRPSLLNMLPMVGMALMMGVSGYFLSGGRALYTAAPMGVMVLLMAFVQRYTHRRAVEAHQAEVAELEQTYRNHLTQVKEQLEEYADAQRTILAQENPPLEALLRRAGTRAGMLWERQPTDDDFLAARIGTATLPICVEIKAPDDDDDPRMKAALAVIDSRRQVPDLPISVNLNHLGSAGIRGNRVESLYTAFHIIANLVVHHSPDDVHLYIISHRSDAPDLWAWARWLPHTAAFRGAPPRISFRRETDESVLDELAQLLRRRDEQNKDRNSRRGESQPYLVVIFDQAPDLTGHPVISLLLEHEPSRDQNGLRAAGIFIDAPLPHQVNVMIAVEGNRLSYRETWMSNAEQVHIAGRVEMATTRDMDRLARSLAPLCTETSLTVGKGALPSNVRLVELLGFTDPRELRLDRLYPAEYDPKQVMTFPVGLNLDLKPMLVKLREGGLGGFSTHAMLAGTTGTGKSVLLQAMVLSLALTHPPTHVNFVLADFKGGASELAKLRDLPHVVGFVSDLDAPLVERFRIALESESRRRQELFDTSHQTSGVAVANIRSYNRLHPDEPLPHLVVILDEFAHGKQINPDFQQTMDTIAAQGRALGVHLILSTQRATDFDQKLRGNIGLRLSLRVANMEESKAIFNRPEAFTSLTRPGQAFMQVGDNEVWEMFQAGRADLPYHTDQTRNIDLLDDFAVYRVDPDGRDHQLYMHRTGTEKKAGQSMRSEAEVLVERVIQHCDEYYPPSRIICLPALPPPNEMPLLSLLARLSTYTRWDQGIWSEPEPRERLKLPIGLLDIPAMQDQRPYVIDLNERDGNFVVFGPSGSGKLLFLQSLLLGLAATHPPDDVHLYVLAQSASLAVFEEIPHCGAVITTSETERVRRLFKFLNRTVDDRRMAMKRARVPDMTSLRAQGERRYPAMIVVLEDYPGFKTDYPEETDALLKLVATGKSVDIHLIIGGPSMTGFQPSLRDNMRNRLALGAVDLYEIHGRRGVPLQEIKGRGYAMVNQDMLECQIAAPARKANIAPETSQATDEIRSVARLMNTSWVGERPVEIRSLPYHLRLLDLWRDTSPAAAGDDLPTAPVGMDYDELAPTPVELRRLDPVTFVAGPQRSGKTEYLMTLALSAARAAPPQALQIIVIALRRNHLHHLHGIPNIRVATKAAEAQDALQAAIDERLPGAQVNGDDAGGQASVPHLLILVDDAARLIQADGLPKLVDRCLSLSRENNVTIVLAETGANIAQMKTQAAAHTFLATAFRQPRGVSLSLDQGELAPLGLGYQFKTPFINTHKQHFGQGRGLSSLGEGYPVIQFATIGAADVEESDYQAELAEIIRQIAGQWPAKPTPVTMQED